MALDVNTFMLVYRYPEPLPMTAQPTIDASIAYASTRRDIGHIMTRVKVVKRTMNCVIDASGGEVPTEPHRGGASSSAARCLRDQGLCARERDPSAQRRQIVHVARGQPRLHASTYLNHEGSATFRMRTALSYERYRSGAFSYLKSAFSILLCGGLEPWEPRWAPS